MAGSRIGSLHSVRLSSYYKRENKPAFGSLNTEVKEWQSRKNSKLETVRIISVKRPVRQQKPPKMPESKPQSRRRKRARKQLPTPLRQP